MALAAGTQLGPYEILAPLGAGGMGQVYRARDTRLGREVAVKVLHDEVAADPERLARFEREARLLAALNHPNIATIHGLEEFYGAKFLVMELVPGETLADRLAAEPLPLAEALGVCRQIAEALEAAHEQGIIHRDLKPANVKVTPAGKVKVLDFGLAKAVAVELVTVPGTAQTESYEVTREGAILGSPAYMSPEQARGQSLDRRTDIWSFGCILFECLSGHRPFTGVTVADTLAAILEREPAWALLPASIPARVKLLLQRCLRKDPNRRLKDIGEARLELEETLAGPPEVLPATHDAYPSLKGVSTAPGASMTITPRWFRSKKGRRWLELLAVLALGILVGGIALFYALRNGTMTMMGANKPSVAVLPFTTSATPEENNLAHELIARITNQLSEKSDLKVSSRAAVAKFGQESSSYQPQVWGSMLSVKTVLTGRIVKHNNPSRYRLLVELVDVNTGTLLWGGQFDVSASGDDTSANAGMVAREIVDQVHSKLTGGPAPASRDFQATPEK